jgi:hypothetical protein
MTEKIFVFVEGHKIEGRECFPSVDLIEIPVLFSELERLEMISQWTGYHCELAKTLRRNLGVTARYWGCRERVGCICIDCRKKLKPF